MILIISLFTVLYVVFYLTLYTSWKNILPQQAEKKVAGFSVIIPARNEEKHLPNIIRDLAKQNFPKEKYEVIVVDDFSEDRTFDVVKELMDVLELDLKVIRLESEETGKKHSITKGVNEAKFPVIITTDADCQIGEEWLKTYGDSFSEETKMLAGPVALEGDSIFSEMQKIEYAGLMGYGAFSIQKKIAGMCSGANLAFSKTAFQEVGGYKDNLFLPTGDDEFLLYAMMTNYPNSVQFLKKKTAIVRTEAHHTLKDFINQRTRWVSKWRFNKSVKLRINAMLYTIDFLIYFFTFIATFIGLVPFSFLLTVVLVRFFSLIPYALSTYRFLGGKRFYVPYLIMQILYPTYIIFISCKANFGKYTWKGRRY